MNGYRIVKPVRFFMFVLILVLSLTLSIYLLISHDDADATTLDSNTYKEVTVTEGDTVWSIAEDNYGNDIDLREAVSNICKINDIDPGEIQPGDQISIPM